MSLINEMKMVVSGVVGDPNQADEIVYALIRRFGGERLYLPCNDYQARNREIVDLFSAGASVDHLAKRYRLSAKTVYRITGQSD